jgi:hypothetical protein
MEYVFKKKLEKLIRYQAEEKKTTSVKLKSSVGAMFGMGAVFITGNTIFL